MINMPNKIKTILNISMLLSIGTIICKGIYDYSIIKILKDFERKLKHNTWDYYE